uniref:Uncharacterized protein n=1 Tax=Panagrolaimus davidi TaxID=227884 RepID=A0A914P0Q9_9BILA
MLRLLNLNKPKNLKPTKGFHFEPSNFNENEFIERKNKLVEEDEERERKEKLAAFKKAHPPPPIQKPPPKPVPPIQTPKLPPKPSIEPVKINLKLQPNTVPLNKETQKLKRPPVVFTSSSESSSSDDDYEKRSKSSKSKKSKSFRSPSPQKERKSKSPQKSKHIDSTVSKEKANHVSTVDKFNNKHQPPIKTTLRKPMPPELNAFYPSMNLSGYKIPKIGDPTPPPMPQPTIKSLIHEPGKATKSVEPMQQFLKPEEPQDTVPKTVTKSVKVRMPEFLKPQEPWKAKEDVVRVKENIVETLKIKYSSLSHNMDKGKKEKHHHHHHSSKNSERSNSVISNHIHKSPNNIERSGSLNRETTTKVPSLVIKPPQKFKHPNDIKKEDKHQSKEKEKSSSSKDKAGISIKIGSIPLSQKDTVKTEEKSLKTKIEIPKSENPERPIPQQPLKLKINFGSKKPAGKKG